MELECRLAEIRRKHKKMTQQELSDLTGVGVNKISAYENSKIIMSLQTAYIIADAIGCRVDSLYRVKK